MSYLLPRICDERNDDLFGSYTLDFFDPLMVRLGCVRSKDDEFHASVVKLRNKGLVDGEFCS